MGQLRLKFNDWSKMKRLLMKLETINELFEAEASFTEMCDVLDIKGHNTYTALRHFVNRWRDTKHVYVVHTRDDFSTFHMNCPDWVSDGETLRCDGNCPMGNCVALRISTAKTMKGRPIRDDPETYTRRQPTR